MSNNEHKSYAGFYAPNDSNSAIQFAIKAMLGKIETATISKVIAVHGEMVDLQPLVQQLTADGKAIDHAIIYNVPFLRVQGGSNAIIIDPHVGDLGITVFCHRDITNVVANKDKAKPASLRQYDLSDAVYVGGLLNGTPTQYVQFTDDGIVLKSPHKVTIDTPTAQFTGDVAIDGTLIAKGVIKSMTDVIAKAISLIGHRHSGVRMGDGRTGGAV